MRMYDLFEAGEKYATVRARDAKHALEKAKARFDATNYTAMADATQWIDIEVRARSDANDTAMTTVQVDPPAPKCIPRGRKHTWESPIEVLGGLKENPGVWGHGAGVIRTEVCRHCGAYRKSDSWAQRMDTGEQGLNSVEYLPCDESSWAWVRSMAGEEVS